MERYATHQHHVVLREKIAEEPVYKRVPTKDGWHWEDQVWYTRKLFKRWTANTECTLDIPEGNPSSWRLRSPRPIPSNEEKLEEKNCYWWLEYYPNIRSNKDNKRLTNGALRSRVRQQLHSAVRDYGRWVEDTFWGGYYERENPWPEDLGWEDVDIAYDIKYASRGWWD
jgi:hypothetical protein